MIVAAVKMHFLKMKPRYIRYRKYKNFNNDAFVNTLRQELTKKFVHMFLINIPPKQTLFKVKPEIFHEQ